MKFVASSDDPILNELGNGEMNDFVVHSCAHQHGNQHGCHKDKSDHLLKIAHSKEDQKPNQPTVDKTLLSDTYITLKNKVILSFKFKCNATFRTDLSVS
jgi:hypothetical protein